MSLYKIKYYQLIEREDNFGYSSQINLPFTVSIKAEGAEEAMDKVKINDTVTIASVTWIGDNE